MTKRLRIEPTIGPRPIPRLKPTHGKSKVTARRGPRGMGTVSKSYLTDAANARIIKNVAKELNAKAKSTGVPAVDKIRKKVKSSRYGRGGGGGFGGTFDPLTKPLSKAEIMRRGKRPWL